MPCTHYKLREQSGRKRPGGADWQQAWCESSVGLEAKRANWSLGCKELSITNWSKEMIILLYLVLIRLHPEHCVNFSAPEFKKGVMGLEFIQRRATKLVKGLERLCCEEGLGTLVLCSSEERRLKENLVGRYGFLRKRCAKGDTCLSSLVYSGRKCVGTVQNCTWVGLDWTLGNISLLRRWASTTTGLLER